MSYIDRWWHSEEFKSKLEYERKNGREKFIYDANKILNAYSDIEGNIDYICIKDDPQLLALLFSFISITHNKDDLTQYLQSENLSSYKRGMMTIHDNNHSSSFFAHTMSMREKNLDIDEEFVIPKSTLTTYEVNSEKKLVEKYNINDWTFKYDPNIISVNDGVVKALKKGIAIIECKNNKNNDSRLIKINCGNIKQARITEFFFTQIRNIIAHGRFELLNSGFEDTIALCGEFDMPSTYDEYKYGSHRELRIYENNQLNVAYNGENTFNPKYIIHLAKTLYAKEDNPFIKLIKLFDNKSFVIINELKNLSNEDKQDFESLLLLSKFYINFIYNFDSEEKENFNYETLPINDNHLGNLTKKEFVYEIRTAIMHGRYRCEEDYLHFWNFDKKNTTTKTFYAKISKNDFITLFTYKEILFYKNMKYNPDELISERRKKQIEKLQDKSL